MIRKVGDIIKKVGDMLGKVVLYCIVLYSKKVGDMTKKLATGSKMLAK